MDYYFLFCFFVAFLLTNFIEFFPLILLVKKPLKEKAVALVLINAITLPIVWVASRVFYNYYAAATVLLEVFAIAAETGLIKIALKQNLKDSFKAAFAMNFLSATIGSAIFLLLP